MVQKTEGKKTAEQKSAENKQTLRKPQNGSNVKAAGKNETSERTQQKREVKTAVNKAQQSREVKIVEKTAENAQPEKLSSSAKTTEKTVKPTEKRTVCHGKETDRQPRQVQPQTSMRIVTLSQPVSGRTAADQIMNESTRSAVSKADKQPQTETQKTQSENTAKQAARRRRPRRRPAAKTAAGGGDHEE